MLWVPLIIYPFMEEMVKKVISNLIKQNLMISGIIFGVIEFIFYMIFIDEITLAFIMIRLFVIPMHGMFGYLGRKYILIGILAHISYNLGIDYLQYNTIFIIFTTMSYIIFSFTNVVEEKTIAKRNKYYEFVTVIFILLLIYKLIQ